MMNAKGETQYDFDAIVAAHIERFAQKVAPETRKTVLCFELGVSLGDPKSAMTDSDEAAAWPIYQEFVTGLARWLEGNPLPEFKPEMPCSYDPGVPETDAEYREWKENRKLSRKNVRIIR